MIVIKVWCLPANQSEDDLNRLHQAIVNATVSVSDLPVESENDIVCLFPSDLMEYGLGEEIIIEIDGVPDIFQRNQTVREKLAEHVGKSVSELYAKAKVSCVVRSFDCSEGNWPPRFSEDEG